MGTTTFSGPIRSGTVRTGGTTTMNAGTVVLTQSATVGFAVMLGTPAAQALFTIPAGSKILNFIFEKTTAIAGGSVSGVNVTLGSSGTANLYLTTMAMGLTVARTTQAVVDAQIATAGCKNVGTSDAVIYGTFTAAGGDPTSGEAVVTIMYAQRAADGSTAAIV